MRPAPDHRNGGRWPRPRRYAALAGLAVAVAFAAAPSALIAASDPRIEIGRSVVVVNQVEGKWREETPKRLQINDDIIFEEDVTTRSDAKTVIEFRDGSTFELGPDAVVRIDSFIYNPQESTSHKTLSITSGAFRYMSGSQAHDQDTKIATYSGTLGVRGSIVSGVVVPNVPVFLHLTEGDATFVNDAGDSRLQPGNSIAVPSRHTRPMRADLMPCPVAEQALRAIAFWLPPDQALRERPPPSEEVLRREKAANELSVAEQQSIALPVTGTGPSAPTKGAPIAADLQLLTEANSVDAFNGAQSTQTPEQRSLRARLDQQLPDACSQVAVIDAAATSFHAELVQQLATTTQTPPAPADVGTATTTTTAQPKRPPPLPPSSPAR
jgi:hypothetical protein